MDFFYSICTIFLGVSRILQIYQGPRQSIDKIGQVKLAVKSTIIEIDRDSTEIEFNKWIGGPTLELLPGNHKMTVIFPESKSRIIEFTVKSDHIYELDQWGKLY